MSKLTKRKSVVEVENRCPNHYEIQKENRQKAIEIAENTPDEIKNKKIRYLLK
jgi:hypothetical protein